MRNWIKGPIVGFVTAGIGALLILSPLGVHFEQSVGLSWLFNLRGPITAPKDVVIVAINDQTGEHLGISRLPREWPRSLHGRLVENLTRQGATTIAFDMDFQLPKQHEDDLAFAKAVEESDRVVLVEKLIGKRQPLFNSAGQKKGSVWIEQLALPIPALADTAKGLGPFPLPKVQVAVHQFWVFKRSVGNSPTMPAVALQIHAMPAYPYFAQLLTKAGIQVPKQPPEESHADDIRRFMLELRSIFVSRPQLNEQLKEMLANENVAEIPNSLRPLVLSLISLYSGGDQNYLNFYGPPGSITTVPYYLFADDRDMDSNIPDLTGKAAFVGFSDLYDPGQPDRFFTVFTNDDGVDLSGVEIAATAFANLKTDSVLRNLGVYGEIMVIGFYGLVIGLIAYLSPAIAGVPLILSLSAGYFVIAYNVFAESNLWLPLAIPLLVQLPLAMFGGLFTHYILERQKKIHATQAMSLYLPQELAREITEKNKDTSSVNRVVYGVCFASDMAGFTTIAEQMPPKELAVFLNEYFEALSGPLRRYGVDVIEFRADGIMCAWTGEQANTEIHRKALLAGLEAVEAIAQFKERHNLLNQNLRIGLETGTIYVGHAGGGGHFVFSIVGDPANTAARIEGLNKQLHTQLLASASTLEGVDGLLCRFLGNFRFVGKTEILPIFEIVALSEFAKDSQKQLCEQFDTAINRIKASEWSEAAKILQFILQEFPGDGPSRFHLERCRQFEHSPPDHPPLVIHLNVK